MTIDSPRESLSSSASQYSKTSGDHNVCIQIAGNGNNVLVPDQPHLELTRHLQRRQVRKNDDGTLIETDLLSAYTQSVSLVGRQQIFQDFWDWLKKDVPISVRVLVGSAGRGKTRLALALCEKATQEQWGAGFLTSSELMRFQTQQNAADWGWKKPVLVVIDYVSSQALQVHDWLVELADNPALGDPAAGKTRPLRVLLLERQAAPDGGWWQVVFGYGGGDADAVQRLLDLPDPIALPPIDDPKARREIIALTMKRAGSSRQLRAVGHDPSFDEKLAALSWGGEPLFLMMAALTAVKADFAEVLALSRDDLAFKIARRELARIGRISKVHGIPEDFARHMAATITLCQGLDSDDAFTAIEREKEALGRENAGDKATIHKALTEALSPNGSVLDPILPDMIGEAAMLLTWNNEKTGSESVLRAIKAAEHSKSGRSKVVESVIRTCQDYAQAYPISLAWLYALGKDAVADLPNLLALCNALPADTLELRECANALTQTAVDQLRERATADPAAFRPDLANSLNTVSNRLSQLGRREDALTAGEESVMIYRELAAVRPAAFRPALAGSLNNVSYRLSNLGRREDALAAGEESLAIRRELAAARPDAFLSDFANSLNTVSNRLSQLGRREDALAAGEESVTIYRELAAARPDVFRPTLASSLNNVSYRLSKLERLEDAFAAGEEALSIRRELAAARPDAFLSDFVDSLHNVSSHLSNLGRYEDALAAGEESVTIYRELAAARPDVFRSALAGSLNNVSSHLSNLGRREDALAAGEESLVIRRELAAARPDVFRPALVDSLHNVSSHLSNLGRREDALAAGEESVTIYRELAAARPDVFRPALAGSLNNVSSHLSDLGRREDAFAAGEESVTIRRELAAARPAAFRPALAGSLHNVSNRLSKLGRREDALAAGEEAVTIYRELAAVRPAAFRPALADSLNNVSYRLSKLERLKEALAAGEEAVTIRRELAAARPDVFRPALASSLDTVSSRLSELGRHEDALPAIEQSFAIFRELAAARPDAFRPTLAEAYSGLGRVFQNLHRHLEAVQSFGEGLAAIAPHLAQFPQAFASLAVALRQGYLQSAQDADIAPDMELLQPITEKLMEIGEITYKDNSKLRGNLDVMDMNIGGLASTALNLALVFFNATAVEVVDEAGKAAGAKVVDWLKSKLTASDEQQALKKLEAEPGSLGVQKTFEDALLARLEKDGSFAKELKSVLEAAGATQTMTQTGDHNVGSQISGSGNTVNIGRN